MFDCSCHGRKAGLLKRGKRLKLYDYTIEFWTLVVYTIEFWTLSSGWNNQALSDVFFEGLSKGLKDELVSWELPFLPQELMDLAG